MTRRPASGLATGALVSSLFAAGLAPVQAQEAHRLRATAPVAALPRQQRAVPFGVGERFEYDVKFGPMKVGRGAMEVSKIDTVRGRPAWHIVFNVKGGTFFYKVDDTFQSWIDTSSLASLRFWQDQEEGGRERRRRYEIFPERRVYREGEKEEQPSVEGPLDDGSFLYFVRTMDLEIGQTYDLDRYFRADRNPVRIKVLRRERITVPAGTYETIVIQPFIKTSKIFSQNGKAEIWLTEDDRRMMVQVKTNLSFGTLNLFLRKSRAAGAAEYDPR